jgi:hypothetical protein
MSTMYQTFVNLSSFSLLAAGAEPAAPLVIARLEPKQSSVYWLDCVAPLAMTAGTLIPFYRS